MKAGFGQVMSTLHDIRHGDALLQKTVNKNKADYEEKLSDVVHMVLSLQVKVHTKISIYMLEIIPKTCMNISELANLSQENNLAAESSLVRNSYFLLGSGLKAAMLAFCC